MLELFLDVAMAVSALADLAAGVHHIGAAGSLPDGQVITGVAGVIKALHAEFGDQSVTFAVGREVDVLVGRQDLVEQAEVFGDLLGIATMAGRCQDDAMAFFLLALDQFDDRLVVRQYRDVHWRYAGQAAFQVRLATGQPA